MLSTARKPEVQDGSVKEKASLTTRRSCSGCLLEQKLWLQPVQRHLIPLFRITRGNSGSSWVRRGTVWPRDRRIGIEGTTTSLEGPYMGDQFFVCPESTT